MDANLDARIEEASRLLPAWFVPRMMGEEWVYGLMMASGNVIAVERIEAVRRAADGALWLDVSLAPADDYWGGNNYDPSVFGAPSSRRRASVNAAHVAAAFELVDRRDAASLHSA
jgi:hypothetical protein